MRADRPPGGSVGQPEPHNAVNVNHENTNNFARPAQAARLRQNGACATDTTPAFAGRPSGKRLQPRPPAVTRTAIAVSAQAPTRRRATDNVALI